MTSLTRWDPIREMTIGVLTVEIPLAQHAQPKRITIQSVANGHEDESLVESATARQLETAGARG